MTQYNTLNVKLSSLQLNKLKPGIKNGTEVILNLSLNVIGDSQDETNFLHKLLLTDTQVSRLRKAFANVSLAITKLSKAHQSLSKLVQLRGFLCKHLDPLMKVGLQLMKNVLTPLAKSVLIPLEFTTAASATDAATQKNIFGSGMTTLIISNTEMIS